MLIILVNDNSYCQYNLLAGNKTKESIFIVTLRNLIKLHEIVDFRYGHKYLFLTLLAIY